MNWKNGSRRNSLIVFQMCNFELVFMLLRVIPLLGLEIPLRYITGFEFRHQAGPVSIGYSGCFFVKKVKPAHCVQNQW